MFVRIVGVVLVFLVGWVIFVARPSSGSGPKQVYVVKPHDTLWTIASAHYGGDPREAIWNVERRNHLAGAMITPGQKLVLP
jgi:nucleoid-associated protein YgaU